MGEDDCPPLSDHLSHHNLYYTRKPRFIPLSGPESLMAAFCKHVYSFSSFSLMHIYSLWFSSISIFVLYLLLSLIYVLTFYSQQSGGCEECWNPLRTYYPSTIIDELCTWVREESMYPLSPFDTSLIPHPPSHLPSPLDTCPSPSPLNSFALGNSLLFVSPMWILPSFPLPTTSLISFN